MMTKTRVTTVLCDLDGTLIESNHAIAAAFQHAWGHVMTSEPAAADEISRHIGKPLEVMAQALGLQLSAAELDVFLATYRGHFNDHGAALTKVYPGVEKTLERLSELALGVVTTEGQGPAEIVLSQLGLSRFFGQVQGMQPGLRAKPEPDTILAALRQLGSTPKQALMVGDTPADILAGRAAGVRTCAVSYGFGDAEAMGQCEPDYAIDAFGELVGVVERLRR